MYSKTLSEGGTSSRPRLPSVPNERTKGKSQKYPPKKGRGFG